MDILRYPRISIYPMMSYLFGNLKISEDIRISSDISRYPLVSRILTGDPEPRSGYVNLHEQFWIFLETVEILAALQQLQPFDPSFIQASAILAKRSMLVLHLRIKKNIHLEMVGLVNAYSMTCE